MLTLTILSLILGFVGHGIAIFFEYTFDEGMIFHWYNNLIEKLPEWLYKPLGGCIICHGTWLTILFNLAFFYGTISLFEQTISVLISIASFSYFINKYMNSYD